MTDWAATLADWFTTDLPTLTATVLSALAVYAVLIGLVRLVGLRSFSKMTSVDFAMTIAVGSVVASAILAPTPSLPQAAVALVSLFAIQWVVVRLRKDHDWAESVVDNNPLVLMAGAEMLRDHMDEARVTEDDIRSKLREANVHDVADVQAVVLETTGTITVLHGGGPLHRSVFHGVRGADRLDLTD